MNNADPAGNDSDGSDYEFPEALDEAVNPVDVEEIRLQVRQVND
jgi:hypothetical protein